MSNFLIDLLENEKNDFIIDLENKLELDGHTFITISSISGQPIDKLAFELIINANFLILLHNPNTDEHLLYSKLENILDTASADYQERSSLLIIFPGTNIDDFEILSLDDVFILDDNWKDNIYLQSLRIYENINEISSPNIEHNEIKTRREIKANIEQNAPEFVNTAIKGLETRGKNLNITANIYFFIGIIAISLSIYVSCSTVKQFIEYIQLSNPWPIATFLIIKGIVIISLFVALSKYAVQLGKSYMHESLKIKERIHAISLGQFYLNVYKEGVSPTDLKEVFRDWNLSNQNSAFASHESKDFDPKLVESIANIIEKSKELVKTATESTKT